VTAAVELSGLGLAYPGGEFRLLIETLRLEPGERAALVGPSGSGKTTLLNLLAGILHPDSGRIRVDGEDLTTLDDARRREWRATHVGLVFQHLALLPYLDGLDNVLLPLRLAGRTIARDDRERARALAEDFGVTHTLTRRPARLSGGEQQRLALARALIGEPRLLLLDEPTGSLDRANAHVAHERLWAAADRHGSTVVMVTHDPELAARCSTRIDAGAGFALVRDRCPDTEGRDLPSEGGRD
jgi:putative ABC transport system ATP-binding protein